MHQLPLYGAIEAGGTKFVCAVAREPHVLLAQTRIATTTPAATLEAALTFFAEQEKVHGTLKSIGIASFGPVDVREESSSYGHILATPKAGWSHTDLCTPFIQRFHCPVGVDTDVNAAALAEATLGIELSSGADNARGIAAKTGSDSARGATRGCDTLVYVTVGTGIGGGIYTDGRTHKGRLHPEMGHIRVLRHPADRDFKGCCPFHGDCLEGLASGPAILARYGVALDTLPPDHPAFEIIGYYLGQLASTLILLLVPERLVFGGGVMQQAALFPLLRSTAASLLNGYAGLGERTWLDQSIQPPALGNRAGITGAMLLAIGA